MTRPIALGVIGLGRAFALMAPTFAADPRVRIVAGCDPRREARQQLAREFGARGYSEVEALLSDPEVEAVYLASPHQLHAEHACLAASAGKHVLVEKPMAVTLDEATAMIAAAQEAGVALVVGHSHSFDAPILHTRARIATGEFGAVRMVSAMNATDFLYRPRRPEELDTGQGGGVLFSQAAHQVDIVRLLAGGQARSVRAHTGAWDPARPTEGAYAALIDFASGAFASLVYSGYGRFDTDQWCGDVGEMGQPRDAARYGSARRLLVGAGDAASEAALKRARTYGGERVAGTALRQRDASHGVAGHQHFGVVIVSCERADLRPLPFGVMIYGDDRVDLDRLPPPAVPRAEVIDEFHAAVAEGVPARHDGTWGRATLEVCLAMLASSRRGEEIALQRQCAWRDRP